MCRRPHAARSPAALQHSNRPEKLFSVFAGQDKEATEQARSCFVGYPPSSPSIVLLQDGKVVHMMHRSDIEHREAVDIASELKASSINSAPNLPWWHSLYKHHVSRRGRCPTCPAELSSATV